MGDGVLTKKWGRWRGDGDRRGGGGGGVARGGAKRGGEGRGGDWQSDVRDDAVYNIYIYSVELAIDLRVSGF